MFSKWESSISCSVRTVISVGCDEHLRRLKTVVIVGRCYMCACEYVYMSVVNKPQRGATRVAKHEKEDRPHIPPTYRPLRFGANPCNGARGNQKEAKMAIRRKQNLLCKVVNICVRFLQYLIVRLILRVLESLANGEM